MRLYRIDEAAEILRISPRTLATYVQKKQIAHVKMAGKKSSTKRLTLFRQEDLDAFISKRAVKAEEVIE